MVVRTVVENSISLISTLTFESVQNIHIGTYTCMARNDYGDHSSSVFLRLAGEDGGISMLMTTLCNMSTSSTY